MNSVLWQFWVALFFEDPHAESCTTGIDMMVAQLVRSSYLFIVVHYRSFRSFSERDCFDCRWFYDKNEEKSCFDLLYCMHHRGELLMMKVKVTDVIGRCLNILLSCIYRSTSSTQYRYIQYYFYRRIVLRISVWVFFDRRFFNVTRWIPNAFWQLKFWTKTYIEILCLVDWRSQFYYSTSTIYWHSNPATDTGTVVSPKSVE